VLAVTIGSFGDRFAKIAAAFGAEVERFEVPWGEAADPQVLAAHLAANPPYRAVLLTHNETSTGVTNPLRELAAAVRNAPGDPLVVVDGISGLGAMPFEMDAWGIDLVVSASQKAWMGSPGIAIAALGERAWTATETARMPRVYWDFGEARTWAAKGQTPWTPAVSVLFGLRVGVRRLVAEGREQTWARHAAIAAAVQAGLEALGLQLVAAPQNRSTTVTAAWLPDGLEWGPFNAAMRAKGLVVAGGQGASCASGTWAGWASTRCARPSGSWARRWASRGGRLTLRGRCARCARSSRRGSPPPSAEGVGAYIPAPRPRSSRIRRRSASQRSGSCSLPHARSRRAIVSDEIEWPE
jgi:aspartate aminotransferase-like enzyme